MKDLIEAFQIFAKYTDEEWPTHCEHDVMYVNVNPEKVTAEDKERLQALGFDFGSGDVEDVFYSFRFGSC